MTKALAMDRGRLDPVWRERARIPAAAGFAFQFRGLHAVLDARGLKLGELECEYHGPTGLPGYVGHTPGRRYWTFRVTDERLSPIWHLHRYHGHRWERLADAKADLLAYNPAV